MRLFEFASAEEQLALWKLISTSVWSAIEQQVQQQQQERAAQAKRSNAKGKTARARVAAPVALPVTAPPPPSAATAKQQQPAQDAAAAAAVGSVGTAVQPVGSFAKRTEKDKADDTEDSASTVLSMRKKLR